jgi:UDP-sulfoquinovose synthase
VAEEFTGSVEIATGTPNPRVEKEEHYYRAAHTKLLDLGLVPHLLSRSTIASILAVAERNRDRIDPDAIAPTVNWRHTAAGTPVAEGQKAGSPRS